MTSAVDRLRGAEALLETERRVRSDAFWLPPKLTLSEWADAYRMLSSESSAEPGRWRTGRAPYLREIMDACSDPLIERVVFMKPAQIGWTEVLNNVAGYFIDQDPCPILLLQPTVDLAKMWSKERLDPMLRDTPKLHGKIREGNRREKDQSIQRKTFPGGFLAIQGANSAAGLRARPIRVVIADEVDGYPQSAKGSAKKDARLGMIGEGDPLSLAVKRTSNFWNRKILEGSTPTLAGFSRIERDYGFSDQREFYLACPHCGYEQTLKWRNLRWESGKPETAAYLCGAVNEHGELTAGCGQLIEEHQKGPMLARGRWIAARPGRRIAGFRINALYSPWRTWAELAAEWLEVHDKPEELKVFVNTVLAESWEDRGEVVSESVLLARREQYPAEVPGAVGLLTCAVDVQGDRLEVLLVGWGVGEESWRVHHEKLWGDPAKAEVWAQLDLVREREWGHESGAKLKARWTFVDSGGHHSDAVYRYCRARRSRNVYAVKGFGEPGRAPVGNPSKLERRSRTILFPLGSNALKDLLFARMKTLEAGPGYMHFPMTTTDEYCRQLVSEKVVTRYVSGRPTRAYVLIGGRSNEALDLECYALAALIALGPLREQLPRLVEKLAPPKPKDEPPPPVPEPPPPSLAQQAMQQLRRPGQPKRGGWVTGGGQWGTR